MRTTVRAMFFSSVLRTTCSRAARAPRSWVSLVSAAAKRGADGTLAHRVALLAPTHVAHHLYSSVPCYRAMALTEAIKPILGDLYLYDPKPIYAAVWDAATTCHQ